MKFDELKNRVSLHRGIFYCVGRGGNEETSKKVDFIHTCEPPEPVGDIPDIGMLKEFYKTFGNLRLYFDERSGESAFYIARPDEWGMLSECFHDWIDDDFNENPDMYPYWANDCIAVGEIPASGNYILMPLGGEKQGYVYEFEHDGYEFIEHAANIGEFVAKMLEPDSNILTHMAVHMTFIENDPQDQWWIKEMSDNYGRVVRTNS